MEYDGANDLFLKFPDSAAAFKRECEALQALQGDERVVRLAGIEAERPCIKLLAAPGRSLDDYLKYDGAFPEAEANMIVSELAIVLEHMHSLKGGAYVHYDLSPPNIFWDAAERDVTVIDFGTSYKLSDIPGEYSNHDVGTPLYMSPEKLAHLPEFGAASDMYALGAIWYELLSGSPPFDPAVGNLVRQILCDEPLPLNRVSPDVWATVQSLLAKEPHMRPTARELVDWFERRSLAASA